MIFFFFKNEFFNVQIVFRLYFRRILKLCEIHLTLEAASQTILAIWNHGLSKYRIFLTRPSDDSYDFSVIMTPSFINSCIFVARKRTIYASLACHCRTFSHGERNVTCHLNMRLRTRPPLFYFSLFYFPYSSSRGQLDFSSSCVPRIEISATTK